MFPEISDFIGSRIKAWGESRAGTPSLGLKASTFTGDWYERNGFHRLAGMAGDNGSWAGERVNVQSAMNHSVVWACNRVISEPVGFLPLRMMQRSRDGKEKRIAEEHPLDSALHNAPNDEISAQSFREMVTSFTVLRGDGFARIFRRSTGAAMQLDYLLYDQVNVDRERGGQRRLVYEVSQQGEPNQTFTVEKGKPQDILHIRGIGGHGLRGYSVLHYARQSWGTAIAAERNVASFYHNGGRVPYILKKATKFKTDDDYRQWRTEWDLEYSRPNSAPLIEGDLTYEKIGLSMVDSQMLETRQFSIPEICRWFSVSPHLVGDLSKATFSNIEELALQFIMMTLSAWITRWEQELWRCALTPQEKADGYYFKHNLAGLLRGDFQTRMAGYATMLQNGIASVDEVRDLEDWNPLPDGAGEEYHIQLNMQALPAGAPQSAQSAQLIRLGKKGRAA